MWISIERLAAVCSLVLALAWTIHAEPAALPTSAGATITSDELEMQDNGAKTFFTGHVVLTQKPYVLHADKMVQTKTTQLVEAFGHIHGTWISDQGEKIIGVGERGTYDPVLKVTNLWGHAKVTRWQTAVDTAPVVAISDHFTATEADHTIVGHGHVIAQQGERLRVQSDDARYVQSEQIIYFWGTTPVKIHYEDAKQKADFTSTRAEMTVAPKKAKLIDHVKGHVVPL